MTLPTRAARRVLTGAGITTATIIALALPAAAHITINPDSAESGGYDAFDVRVPNEETDANTTKVELQLPADHPIASVSVRPTPGWTTKVTTSQLPRPVTTDDGKLTEAVTRITWSGGEIKPGEFQQFGVSMGPLPTNTDKLYVTALQTYTDKEGKTDVVRWAEIPKGGGDHHGGNAEPEHPAPSITLAKATAPHHVPGTGAGASPVNASPTGTALDVAGLIVAILALGIAVLALRRSGGSGSRPPVSAK